EQRHHRPIKPPHHHPSSLPRRWAALATDEYDGEAKQRQGDDSRCTPPRGNLAPAVAIVDEVALAEDAAAVAADGVAIIAGLVAVDHPVAAAGGLAVQATGVGRGVAVAIAV